MYLHNLLPHICHNCYFNRFTWLSPQTLLQLLSFLGRALLAFPNLWKVFKLIHFLTQNKKNKKYDNLLVPADFVMKAADKKLFKVHSVDRDCWLSNIIPKKKEIKYQLRNKSANRPDINTERFKNVFVNRLIFRCNLWFFYYLYTVCLRYIIYYYLSHLLIIWN